jgi:hypothetical protein
VTWQLANAKVWDGSQWQPAVGGGAQWTPKPITTWATFVTVTANASANTKGAWTEIVASTTADADLVEVSVQAANQSSAIVGILLDLAIGAAGSEVALFQNAAVGGAAAQTFNGEAGYRFGVPVYVPSGSRISARIQSNVTLGRTAQISVRLSAGDNPAGTSTSATVIGANTATSVGTDQANNTSWQQAVASTAAQYQAVSLVPSLNTTGIGGNFRSLQLGFGASSSESPLANVDFITLTTEAIVCTQGSLYVATVPSGTRLATRFVRNATAGVAWTIIATETLGV